MSAVGVGASTASVQGAGRSASLTAALQDSPSFPAKALVVRTVARTVARLLCEERHYLHSYPGAALLDFGVFVDTTLLGVAVLGLGSINLPRLFTGAERREVVCLSRLWLDDRLGRNAESRTLAVMLRLLRRHQTTIKVVVAYSDPLAGHTGTVYRAAGFAYVGLSEAMPLFQLPGEEPEHSRSLSHRFGTHSKRYFAKHGITLTTVPQARKHTYAAFVDPAWRGRLQRPILPYPKGDRLEGR